MNTRHLYLWAFLLSVGAITYYDLKKCHHLPWPPRIIYTGLTFGLLDLFSLASEELAGVMAIGLVIATFVSNGWVKDCTAQTTAATGQPATTTFVGDQTGGPQQVGAYVAGYPPGSGVQYPTSSGPGTSSTLV